jgi:hypothetical protein
MQVLCNLQGQSMHSLFVFCCLNAILLWRCATAVSCGQFVPETMQHGSVMLVLPMAAKQQHSKALF